MIYVTIFEIFSAINGGYATRVHTKCIFTAHAMTNAEKKALLDVYTKQYSGDEWIVKYTHIRCSVINGGETE